jgi:hypothetical protein
MFSLLFAEFCGVHELNGSCDCSSGNKYCHQQSNRCHVLLRIFNTQAANHVIDFVWATDNVPFNKSMCIFNNNSMFKGIPIGTTRNSVNYDTAEEMNADTNINNGCILSTTDISQFSANAAVRRYLCNRNLCYMNCYPISNNAGDTSKILHPNPDWLMEDMYSAEDDRNDDPILGNISELIELTQRAIDELYSIVEEIERPESNPLLK